MKSCQSNHNSQTRLGVFRVAEANWVNSRFPCRMRTRLPVCISQLFSSPRNCTLLRDNNIGCRVSLNALYLRSCLLFSEAVRPLDSSSSDPARTSSTPYCKLHDSSMNARKSRVSWVFVRGHDLTTGGHWRNILPLCI